MIMQAIRHEHPSPRPLYMLGENWFKGYPGVGDARQQDRAGGRAPGQRAAAAARRGPARARLPRGPEGQRASCSGSATGCAASAAAASCAPRCAPACRSCPIAVIGAEEAMPIFAHVPLLQRLTGLIYFPINHAFPQFGLAAALMYLPAKFRIRFLEPIDMSGYSPEDADDIALVQAASPSGPAAHPAGARRPATGAQVGLVRLGFPAWGRGGFEPAPGWRSRSSLLAGCGERGLQEQGARADPARAERRDPGRRGHGLAGASSAPARSRSRSRTRPTQRTRSRSRARPRSSTPARSRPATRRRSRRRSSRAATR